MLDTPPALGYLTINGLTAADILLGAARRLVPGVRFDGPLLRHAAFDLRLDRGRREPRRPRPRPRRDPLRMGRGPRHRHPLRRRPAGRARRADAGLSRAHALAPGGRTSPRWSARPASRSTASTRPTTATSTATPTPAAGRPSTRPTPASSGCCSPPGAATSSPPSASRRWRPPDGPPPPDPDRGIGRRGRRGCSARGTSRRPASRARRHRADRPRRRRGRRRRGARRDRRDPAPGARRAAGWCSTCRSTPSPPTIWRATGCRSRTPTPPPCAPRSGPTASARRSRSRRSQGALPYGLISGWRRLEALKALHAETGEPRFATVQALVRRPETAADAYVAMVEENEIRVGLSQYERARVAARATERGVFPSEKAALLALFATASRPKRSRIRAFLELYHALDGVAALSGAPAGAAGAAARRDGAGRRRRGGSPPPSPRPTRHRRRPSSRSWRALVRRPPPDAAELARRAPAGGDAGGRASRPRADAAPRRRGRDRGAARRGPRAAAPGARPAGLTDTSRWLRNWRRERDSNPRDGSPSTHFPGVRLRPLGHLSGAADKTISGCGPQAWSAAAAAGGLPKSREIVGIPTNRRKSPIPETGLSRP